MRRKTLSISATVAIGLACSILVGLGERSDAATAVPSTAAASQVPARPVGACKKIVTTACSSCDVQMQDKECKSGTEFKECNTPHHTCSNGAQCDQHSGVEDC